MIRTRLTAALLAVAPLLVWAGVDAADPPPAPPPAKGTAARTPPPLRVIVRIDRYTQVAGIVELEEGDVIVVRDERNELHSFAKARVLRIIRLVDPKPGQEGTVYMVNGQRRRGVIISDAFDAVTIEIEGVRTRLLRATVDSVELEPTFEERYAHFKAVLDPGIVEQHFTLCQWLVDKRRYRLAKLELTDLLSRHDYYEARELLNLVDAQLAMAPVATEKPKNETVVEAPVLEPEPEHPLPVSPLTDDDVNLIRVYEIDFNRPPDVEVPRTTIERILETYVTNELIPADPERRSAIYRAEPIDVVQLMFKLRARELYGEIEVLSEPYALNLFRQRVHDAWLMNNCATSRCHGGPDAGRLFLYRRNAKDPKVRYANLLTLERLEVDPLWPLVNYDKPEDSLIIQYGLPTTRARKPHPPVDGWRPVFRRLTDRKVTSTVRWIRAMLQPRIEYPVDFEPPQFESPEKDPEGRLDR